MGAKTWVGLVVGGWGAISQVALPDREKGFGVVEEGVKTIGRNPLTLQVVVTDQHRPALVGTRVGDRTRTGDNQIHSLEL